MQIEQIIDGNIVYQDRIENYNYSVPQFLANGATKITIEYMSSTIIVTPVEGEVNNDNPETD